MNVQVYKNVDLVQINLKAGVSEYFLPQNVVWADEVVDKILVYATEVGGGCVSPIDGIRELYALEDTPNMFFKLYSKDEQELADDLCVQNMLYVNNCPIEINSKLSLKLSRLFFSRPPVKDGCLLLYVFWGTKVIENDERPKNSITVTVNLDGKKDIAFDSFIDTYIHSQGKRVKGIAAWVGDIYGHPTGVYITLRDHNYRTIVNTLSVDMCRPMMGTLSNSGSYWGSAQDVQINPMYLDDEDVNFANSFIHNPDGFTEDLKITILY